MDRLAVFKMLLLIVVFAFSSGCVSKILNPYKDEFACPQVEKGKCVSVMDAYEEALTYKPLDAEEGKVEVTLEAKTQSEKSYEELLFSRLTGLLREPVTPVVAAPPVVRVLFLSYKGEGNELFMPRYIYFFADEPRWVLGDYINEKGAE